MQREVMILIGCIKHKEERQRQPKGRKRKEETVRGKVNFFKRSIEIKGSRNKKHINKKECRNKCCQ